MGTIEQVYWSIAVLLITGGLLAGMVIYTVTVMRTAQMRILTGDITATFQDNSQQ